MINNHIQREGFRGRTLYFLLLAPLIAAVLLYMLPDHPVRDWLVRIAAVVIAGASVYLLATAFNKAS